MGPGRPSENRSSSNNATLTSVASCAYHMPCLIARTGLTGRTADGTDGLTSGSSEEILLDLCFRLGFYSFLRWRRRAALTSRFLTVMLRSNRCGFRSTTHDTLLNPSLVVIEMSVYARMCICLGRPLLPLRFYIAFQAAVIHDHQGTAGFLALLGPLMTKVDIPMRQARRPVYFRRIASIS